MASDRVPEFVELFNRVEDHLRKLTAIGREKPFGQLLREAALKWPEVKANKHLLSEYADLRNLIVHYRDFPRQSIAEPTPETVTHFRSLVDWVTKPKRLGEFTKKRKPTIFPASDPLTVALKEMRENVFSQTVVEISSGFTLLTTEGVSRWLESQVEEDIISVREARISDALSFEVKGAGLFMARNETVYAAREAFMKVPREGRERLLAILVTDHGRKSEKPLAIVTPWDLLEA